MWGDSLLDECQGQVRAAPSVTQLMILSITWLLSSKASMRTLTWKFSAGSGVPVPLFPKQRRGV